MKYNPHDYQKFAIEYIKEHPVAAVILAMGMGKTSITLTAIEDLMYDRFNISKVLIVAPLRVASTVWSDEIKQWDHLKHLRYSKILGTEKERLAGIKKDADIYLINRENLQWLIEKSGAPFDYDMVVIDELSSFKNWSSKRFKAFMKVRPKVKRVVGLTGTPSSNGLMDLFAEFKVLDMGERLGRFITQYRSNYFRPDRMNGHVVYNYKLLTGAEERIYEKISDITISMKAMDHLKMPELINNSYPVYMDEKEERYYEDMKKDLVIPYIGEDEITAANAAVLSNKLCQMANGAVYLDNQQIGHIHDRKLDALEDIIEAANGNPILVAYWFQHDLERIIKRLEALKVDYARLTKEDSIRRWNNGELQVALIHPASAGHGLNLQAGGSTLIWFGLTWSLELYQQTNARLWRQGQTETVVIHHIITKGTIDEDIIKALKRKEKVQLDLINAVKARVGGVSNEDL
ncbi:DEAD/DEAH box helicase [Clostridium sp. UBA7339]|uniref:DEAD/DEAH box helicase n=1 Tax=Clostridium sp. UBA7339 TaxID=1946376 RepID=UPI0032167431